MDYHSLKYFMTQTNLSKYQARWLDFLAEFNYEMFQKPGKSNAVADALSRMKVGECLAMSEVGMSPKILQKLENNFE